MLCAIYRNQKHPQSYLYIEKRDDFSRVPAELIKQLGRLDFVMLLPLASRKKLANADIVQVRALLLAQGYYLQLPPQFEDPSNILK